MGVWGGIIFQPRPDLPDTPPVTVRLQCHDDWFYSPARRVPIRNHQLADLHRTQACPALENILYLREKLVILEVQVAIGQRFECQKITHKNGYEHQRTSGHWFLRHKPIEVFHNDEDLLVICNKTKFRLELFITFKILIS
jgi:hypothetical protein